MYMNFWYPVAKSEDVSNEKPFHAEVMSLPFVAYRDRAGQAYVLSDTCVHRGGSLSRGLIHDDCVACPYHGWRYGGDGKCQLIPSVGAGAKLPGRAKVDSYPVEERYGILFAFLGDLAEDERPPCYTIEEHGQEGWRPSEVIILDVNYYYERSLENGLDAAHNEFVHPTQGFPQMATGFAEAMKLEDVPWGSQFMLHFSELGNEETELKELRGEKNELRAGSGHQGPNNLATWIKFSNDNAFHQYFFEAPVDESSTRIFFVNMRNCMLEPGNDETVNSINVRVANEDIIVLEHLSPVRTPSSNNKEILMPADKPVVRYREYLKDWQERGWRIDFKALQATRGDLAYAIPSPARRESGNWVLDPVPMIPAG